MEEGEKYAKRNVNKVTTDTLFQSPVTINSPKKDANGSYERRITLVILAKNYKRIQGMYGPINNQQLCTLLFRGTCLCYKRLQGTG